MAEPIMITLELSSERSVQIRRCCDKPNPTCSATTHNHNTVMWQATLYCLRCKTELAVMRWKLPSKPADDEPTEQRVPLDTV